MVLVSDLVEAMRRIAPLRYAEPWDKVGLQVGRESQKLDGPVLLTIDLTPTVLSEALAHGARAIVAYHPPIWKPLETITSATTKGETLLRAIEAGIAIYSAHTALDAVPGGVTDWLCEGISGGEPGKIAGDCRALEPATPGEAEVKIVTFVPEDSIENVRNGLATAGAGTIGGYRVCSFSVEGEGTFFGGEETTPVVGEKGNFEKVTERRLEMVCPASAVALALETLRSFHPYEEPAVDVYPLERKPQRRAGAGRRLVLDQPCTMETIAQRLKGHLVHARVKGAAAGGAKSRLISHIGVVPGAGESLAGAAAREGCELFVTGEMRYHEVNAALDQGMSVLLAGHTNTERGFLPLLAARLNERLPKAAFVVSREDRDVLRRV